VSGKVGKRTAVAIGSPSAQLPPQWAASVSRSVCHCLHVVQHLQAAATRLRPWPSLVGAGITVSVVISGVEGGVRQSADVYIYVGCCTSRSGGHTMRNAGTDRVVRFLRSSSFLRLQTRRSEENFAHTCRCSCCIGCRLVSNKAFRDSR